MQRKGIIGRNDVAFVELLYAWSGDVMERNYLELFLLDMTLWPILATISVVTTRN